MDISKFTNDLNADQKEAALTKNNCLALAGPGSGKTKMLAAKASILLTQGYRVLGTTFTKDAAVEIRSRILAQAGNQFKNNLLVGTFHGLSWVQLSPPKKSPYGHNIVSQMKGIFNGKLNIASGGDRSAFVERAIEMSGRFDLDETQAASLIEQCKALVAIGKQLTNEQNKIYHAYQDVLSRSHKIDFQDLIANAVSNMKSGKLYPFPVDYMLVDEFQDTDALQYEWVAEHAKKGAIVTAVGDDDQSIYAFRNALGYKGMDLFARQFNAERVVLGVNYRCKDEILSPSSALIQKNIGRLPKHLSAFKGKGGKLGFIQFQKSDDEAFFAADFCEKALRAKQTVAIIARTNSLLDRPEQQMITYGIPYTRVGGGSILDHKEAAFMLDMLNAACGNTKISGIDNLLAWCGISENSLKSLHQQFGNNFIASENTKKLNESDLDETEKDIYRLFIKRIEACKQAVERNKPSLVIGIIKEFLTEYTDTSYQVTILEILQGLLNRVDAPINKMADEVRKRKSKQEQDEVTVMLITAHGSKGLEYDQVIVIGCNDGTFPDEKSALEEERRLMYVAMTRAKENLMLTSSGVTSPFVCETGLSL